MSDRLEVRSLDELSFVERFTAQVPHAAWSRVEPTPVSAPRTLAVSPEIAALFGLSDQVTSSDDFAQVFAGNRLPRGASPYAMCYGGHQFGSWAGQLGDGRALALGEVRDIHGDFQTLQLKGAGRTPYSRGADGRAVLRSSLREFLCSEAMHHLGVPTTRALSLVATGDQVMRDMLYDGHPAPEPGAVVCRVAPSFVRFGTFQLPASRGDVDLLRQVATGVIQLDFPHLAADPTLSDHDRVAAMFTEVCQRTATLMVHWMRVGFVHGVMNTDNLSILGLTIDYGPYGWLEDFDPTWTPNTTDASGRRYRYGAQPQVAHWNLLQLANALAALTDDPEPLQHALDGYATAYGQQFEHMMATRLGWGTAQPGDDGAFSDLFAVLQRTEIDAPLFFRFLADVPTDPTAPPEALLHPLEPAWYRPDDITGDTATALVTWLRSWGVRTQRSGLDAGARRHAMHRMNPRYVLRNALAQQAIDAATTGDTAPLHDLWDVLRRPYDDQPGADRFGGRRPEWARNRVGCSMLSCSS